MNARAFAVFLVVLIPASGWTQPPQQEPEKPGRGREERSVLESNFRESNPVKAAAERGMQEDIEVFRRILERKIKALYPPPPNNTPWTYPTLVPSYLNPNIPYNLGMQGGGGFGFQGNANLQNYYAVNIPYNPVPEPCLHLEGVYLKGQGVVYTVTLPSLIPGQKPKPAARKVSEWDSVRRQVLEEKDTTKPSEEKAPGLKDVLLRALAENGHHFKHLGDNESLMIVITVHANRSAPAPALNADFFVPAPAANSPKKEASSRQVQELELLGDLNLKRGRHEEAIAAFKKALELNPGAKQQAALHRKLAQVYLAQDKIDSARAALEQVAVLLKEASQTKTEATPARVPLALPTKLIVSAPKKLLLQAGEDKLTEEQFAAQAHVERIGPAR